MLYDHYLDPTVKTRHANTATVTIDGDTIAEIAGLSLRESGGTDGSYAVGDAKPKEHIHNRWTASGSINRFVWRESAIRKWDIGRKGLLNLPTFEITVTDEVDNSVLYTVTGCTLSDRSMSISANQRIMQDVSFLAMDILDAEPGSGVVGMVGENLDEILPTLDQPVDSGGGIPI